MTPRPGTAPWYGLPPINEDAPPGVCISARVRHRHLHRGEFKPLTWLDPEPEKDTDD
jgi:hypothetical protein